MNKYFSGDKNRPIPGDDSCTIPREKKEKSMKKYWIWMQASCGWDKLHLFSKILKDIFVLVYVYKARQSLEIKVHRMLKPSHILTWVQTCGGWCRSELKETTLHFLLCKSVILAFTLLPRKSFHNSLNSQTNIPPCLKGPTVERLHLKKLLPGSSYLSDRKSTKSYFNKN